MAALRRCIKNFNVVAQIVAANLFKTLAGRSLIEFFSNYLVCIEWMLNAVDAISIMVALRRCIKVFNAVTQIVAANLFKTLAATSLIDFFSNYLVCVEWMSNAVDVISIMVALCRCIKKFNDVTQIVAANLFKTIAATSLIDFFSNYLVCVEWMSNAVDAISIMVALRRCIKFFNAVTHTVAANLFKTLTALSLIDFFSNYLVCIEWLLNAVDVISIMVALRRCIKNSYAVGCGPDCGRQPL